MTTPASNCVKVLRGRVARFTKLDTCGRPILGAGVASQSVIVTAGVIEIKVSAEIETGDEIKVKAFDGSLCISDKYCDQLKWWNTDISFCSVDPALVTMMNPTWSQIIGPDNSIIGYQDNTSIDCNQGFALEVWMQAIGTVNPCVQPAYTNITGQWWYYLLPWCIGATPGDIDLKNDAVTFEFKGRTKPGSSWGVGPYPVLVTQPGTAPPGGPGNAVCGPLPSVVGPNTQMVQMLTTLAPPAPGCGYPGSGSNNLPPVTPVVPFSLTPTNNQTTYPGLGVTLAVAGAPGQSLTGGWGDNSLIPATQLTGPTGGTSCPQPGTGNNPNFPTQTIQQFATPGTPASNLSHTYTCPGSYTITATAGGQTVTQTLVVGTPPTSAQFTLTKGTTPNTGQFTLAEAGGFAGFRFPGTATTGLVIDWGDGTPGTPNLTPNFKTYGLQQSGAGNCWHIFTTGGQLPQYTYTGAAIGKTFNVTLFNPINGLTPATSDTITGLTANPT